MKYSKEITQFLGKSESEIKTLGQHTVQQIELAWVRERPDIVHNLAYPLFSNQTTPKQVENYTIQYDFDSLQADLEKLERQSFGETLYQIKPLTTEELKHLKKCVMRFCYQSY
jgi:hypothetical protein